MRSLTYKPEIGKGSLTLSLYSFKELVWQHSYPSFTQNSDGDLIEDKTLIEHGVMKNVNDVEGLKLHLQTIGVINQGDVVALKR